MQRQLRGVWLALFVSFGCAPTGGGIEDALENANTDRIQEVHDKQRNVGVSAAL